MVLFEIELWTGRIFFGSSMDRKINLPHFCLIRRTSMTEDAVNGELGRDNLIAKFPNARI